MLVPKTKESGLEHVAIIMDGNGRWRKIKGVQGYLVTRLRKASKGNRRKLPRFSIKYLTIFAFSTEN